MTSAKDVGCWLSGSAVEWVNKPAGTALKVTSGRETAMGSADHPFDWDPTPQLSQQIENRQDVALVSSSEQVFVVGLLGGLALLALNLLPILDSLGLIRPRLENDPSCGLVTGGKVNMFLQRDPHS